MCRGLGAYPDQRPGWIGGSCQATRAVGLVQARWRPVIGKGPSRIRVAEAEAVRAAPVRGTRGAAGLLLGVLSGCGVLLGVVAIVADAEDPVVGQTADGSLGVSLLGTWTHRAAWPWRA